MCGTIPEQVYSSPTKTTTVVRPKATLQWGVSVRNAGKPSKETTATAKQLEPGGAQNKSVSGQKQIFSKTI